MKPINAGIIGGAGYTGGELLRLLLFHPQVNIAFVQSQSNAGKPVHQVHTDLLGLTNLQFTPAHNNNADVLFLCGGHGAATAFLQQHTLPENIVVIDLSHDFRHNATASYANRRFIYGLPELNRDAIKNAKSIANPGCFATAIQLALLPLAANGLLGTEVHINATTGSTGAGQAPGATTHFSWRDSNLSVYKAFTHQHLTEITESLQSLQNSFSGKLLFVPQRGNFTRGILSTVHLPCNLDEAQVVSLFNAYYATHPFVVISGADIDLKQVVNTNRCFIQLQVHNGYLLVTSIIDNLLKGASGQAVQNMNLAFGLPEHTGLQLKPSAF